MSIVFTGGGTAGSLTGLIPVVKEIRKSRPDIACAWIAPQGSIGKELIEPLGVSWYEIPAARLRRYASMSNVSIPYYVVRGFFASGKIFKKIHAQVLISAGSFVSPPAALRAHFFGMRIVMIQLDIRPGLSNRLVAPVADSIFVAWPKLTNYFRRSRLSGLPLMRHEQGNDGLHGIKYTRNRPLCIIMGGGTGAEALNKLVWSSLNELTSFANIFHITGKGKGNAVTHKHYHQCELVTNGYGALLRSARLIVSRAGMGAIADFIALKKPAALIPIPESHQCENAEYLADKKAALMWNQQAFNPKTFSRAIRDVFYDDELLFSLSKNIGALARPDAARIIAKSILHYYD